MKLFFSMLLFPLALAATPARALIFCVDDSNELQATLQAAVSNGEDDVIRIEAGIYRSASPDGFVAYDGYDDDTDLEISGGWTTNCGLRLPNLRSTIDGELERPGLDIYGTGTVLGRVHVHHMQFIRGFANSEGRAGGLTIDRGFDIIVESNVFRDNTQRSAAGNGVGMAGGLYASSANSLTVRNNLFSGNDADSASTIATGAAALQCYGPGSFGSFINNTVFDNTADLGAASDIGGVRIDGLQSCAWSVANNSLWGNAGIDLAVAVTNVTLRNNNIDNLGGPVAPESSSGNIDLAPQFTSATNFRPRRSSPLIDAGLNLPVGGLPSGSFDGGPRLVGPNVDIGAYELDVLFEHGFDPAGFSSEIP